MAESTVTSRGRTPLPKADLEALGIVRGDRLRYIVSDENRVRMLAVRPLSRLFGTLEHEGPPVTLQDMERGVADGAHRG